MSPSWTEVQELGQVHIGARAKCTVGFRHAKGQVAVVSAWHGLPNCTLLGGVISAQESER